MEIGREQGVPVRIDAERGKGSHMTDALLRLAIHDREGPSEGARTRPAVLDDPLGLDRSDFP